MAVNTLDGSTQLGNEAPKHILGKLEKGGNENSLGRPPGCKMFQSTEFQVSALMDGNRRQKIGCLTSVAM